MSKKNNQEIVNKPELDVKYIKKEIGNLSGVEFKNLRAETDPNVNGDNQIYYADSVKLTFKEKKSKVNPGIKEIIDTITVIMDDRLNKFEQKIDKRLIEMEEKFDKRFEKIENRLDVIENRLDVLENKVDRIMKCPTIARELSEIPEN